MSFIATQQFLSLLRRKETKGNQKQIGNNGKKRTLSNVINWKYKTDSVPLRKKQLSILILVECGEKFKKITNTHDYGLSFLHTNETENKNI